MSSVVLRVYDLTRGMGSVLAPSIIGQEIEGIWHSGVVAFGKEYFFGGGVQCVDADAFIAMYQMQPSKVIDVGVTEIPKEVFDMWIEDQGKRFSVESYNLIHHNCNHFADEAVQFLTGQAIPAEITTQANELMSRLMASPMGPSILPLIQGVGSGLVPNTNIDIPTATAAHTGALVSPTLATAGAQVINSTQEGGAVARAKERATVDMANPGTPPTSMPALRVIGKRSGQLLSLEGGSSLSMAAIPKLLLASADLEAPARWTAAEEGAVQEHLPALVRRAAAVQTVSARRDQVAISEGEEAALAALARAASDWPLSTLLRVAFVTRTLVVDAGVRAQLFKTVPASQSLLGALATRVLAPSAAAAVSSGTRMMAATALSNCVAPEDGAAHILRQPTVCAAVVDGALDMLKSDKSTADGRALASALLCNLMAHYAAHEDGERTTTLLCAVVEDLCAPPRSGEEEVQRRLLRVAGYLLTHCDTDEIRELAGALGLEAAIAASEISPAAAESQQRLTEDLKADVRALLAFRRSQRA
mmetsp:Transcript_16477/g.44444  ORF Transcript_16477/g.44444 Transcript_16477/m.44444 type:complete len:532 (+) Transcript_16477:113-1708(+)